MTGRAACIALVAMWPAACGDAPPAGEVGEPPAAALNVPDEELRHYLAELRDSVRALPDSGLPRGRLGMALEANGFPEAARASYRQAEALAPDDFRWPYFDALLAARDGAFQNALDTLARALRIDDRYAPAWLWRGDWLLRLGDLEQSRTAFERAAQLGASAQGALGLAMVDIAAGRFEDAVARLTPVAADSTRPRLHRTLGQALRATGQLQAARRALARGRAPAAARWEDPRQAEKLAHTRGYAGFDYAQSLSGGGRARQAIPIFERLRRWHPDQRCAASEGFFFTCNLLNSLSIALARAGRLDEAIALAERGLALNESFAPFHLSLASHLRERRQFTPALEHLDRALALNPASGHAHAQRGRALFALGRHAPARAALQAALRLEPAKPTTLFYLGTVEAALENWQPAVAHFERAITLDPDLALGHLYLARAKGESGDAAGAAEALREAERLGVPGAEVARTKRRLRELAGQGAP